MQLVDGVHNRGREATHVEEKIRFAQQICFFFFCLFYRLACLSGSLGVNAWPCDCSEGPYGTISHNIGKIEILLLFFMYVFNIDMIIFLIIFSKPFPLFTVPMCLFGVHTNKLGGLGKTFAARQTFVMIENS